MTGNNHSSESMSKKGRCYWMCGGRRNHIFWGIFLIVVGLYWLGKIAGWFPPQIHMFWPIVLVLMGVRFVVTALTNKRYQH